MKIATWNVNSLRARMPHVLRFLAEAAPDVLALQETKVADRDFPAAPLVDAGYEVIYTGQKSYNGVAILSRVPATPLAMALPSAPDEAARLLAVQIEGLTLVNVYVPNGEAVGAAKFAYKLAWLDALTAYLRGLAADPGGLLVVGDFNIAPEDRDVHDPAAWVGSVLVSPEERTALQTLMALGLADCFRLFPQAEGSYSWWDYRAAGFRRNLGLRIDLLLGTPEICRRARACNIDKGPRAWDRPSDHAPVWVELSPPG
jgi:exodeoxyribonuclease-3